MLLTTGYLLAGKYEIVRLAERGGMALLYEVRHKELNLPLALKILMATQESDPVQTGYFQNEARALAQLRHPGVPFIVDLGTLEGHPYLLMEWLEGETLGARLKRLGRMELGAVLSICQQIGSVLVAAHGREIVHRDLKPGNIFLCQRPNLPEVVKVLDFGVARVPASTGVEKPPTVEGTLLGTPEYMSPEQAGGKMSAIGPHTDQYALGMLAYAMLRGQPAFVPRDASAEALIHHLAAVPTQPPPPLGDHVGPAVSACIMRALSKRPEDRFATVKDFLTALAEAQRADTEAPTRSGATAALAPAPPPPPPAPAPPAKIPSSPPLRAFALVAVGLLVGAIAGYAVRRPEPPAATAAAPKTDLNANQIAANDEKATTPPSPAPIAPSAPNDEKPPAVLPDLASEAFDLATAVVASPPQAVEEKVVSAGPPGATGKSPTEHATPATVAASTPTPSSHASQPAASPRIEGASLTPPQQRVFASAAMDSHVCKPGRRLNLRPDRDWLKVQIPWPTGLTFAQAEAFLSLSKQRWLDQPVAQSPPTFVSIQCPAQ